MQQTSEPLFRELDRLKTRFTPLCERLADADKQFRNSALPLPEGLVSDLADFKKSLGDLGDSVLGFSKELSLSIDLPVADLDDLNRSLHTIATIEEQRANAAVQQNALAVLGRALGVVRRDRAIYPPLLNCQARARELRDEIMRFPGPELHPEARELSDGRHVISRLLDLIEQQSDLADDEYLRFQHLVGESFGDNLAIAAARGKLEVQPLADLPADKSIPGLKDEAKVQTSQLAETKSLASQPTESEVQAGVLEAIRPANLCRAQSKDSEADSVYQRLLAVPNKVPGPQEPRKNGTLQEVASAKAGSFQTAPAQRVSLSSDVLTRETDDIDLEINSILENISRLAVETTASASNAPDAADGNTSQLSCPPLRNAISGLEDEVDSQTALGSEDPSLTETLGDFVPAGPVSNLSVRTQGKQLGVEHPQPASSPYDRAYPVFNNPELVKAGVSRPVVFGIAVLGVALLIYAAVRLPLMSTSPSPAPPTASQEASGTPNLVQQPQETGQPNVAPKHVVVAKAAVSEAPSSPKLVLQPREVAQPTTIPKQAVTKREELKPPDPPSVFVGSLDGIGRAAGSALSGLNSSIAPPPPPPAPLPQGPIRDVGQLAVKLISNTKPTYPQLARQYRVQGTVRLEIVVSRDGTVEKVAVITGHPLLTQAAAEAVKHWRYQPTVLNGAPVEVITTVDLHFDLSR